MTRHHDWVERLDRFIRESHTKPFKWGSFDCCLFSCDAVRAMTDVDLAADFRGKYRSKTGAAKLMKKFKGVEGIAWKVAAEHSLIEVPALTAQRGDVVLLDTDLGPALGVVSLDGRFAWFAAPEGLAARRLPDFRKAWRI